MKPAVLALTTILTTILTIGLAACGSERKQAPPDPTPKTDVRAADAAAAPPADTAARTSLLPASTMQLVTAIVPDWTSTTAELRLWQREGDAWKQVKEPWPGVVGSAGSAWGIGLHGKGTPAGREGPVKKEGDGKTPAGMFRIGPAFGPVKRPPTPIDLQYKMVDEHWKCIDDPASKVYGQILDDRTAPNDWKSAEDMRRKDALYNWVVDVGHNVARTPGEGSCIFLHVWNGPKSVTAGCTAMDETKLYEVIDVLLPAQAPVFVLLPRAEYDALAATWDLPAIK